MIIMSEPKYIKNPIEYLRNTGLLFEINRQVLHPLGLALSVQLPEDGEQESEIGIINIWDSTDDPEGIVYGAKTFLSGLEKFQKYMDEEGDARMAKRYDELGYYVQDIPDPYYIKNGIELQTDNKTFKVSAKWLEIKVREWYDISLEDFIQSSVALDIDPIYESAVEEHAIIEQELLLLSFVRSVSMNIEVVHTFGEMIILLEELEMKHMRYTMEKAYNGHVDEAHPYKVAWIIAYEDGMDVDNIPEDWFEEQ